MSFGKHKIPKHLIIEDYCPQKKSYRYGWLIMATTVLLLSMLISMQARTEADACEQMEPANISQ